MRRFGPDSAPSATLLAPSSPVTPGRLHPHHTGHAPQRVLRVTLTASDIDQTTSIASKIREQRELVRGAVFAQAGHRDGIASSGANASGKRIGGRSPSALLHCFEAHQPAHAFDRLRVVTIEDHTVQTARVAFGKLARVGHLGHDLGPASATVVQICRHLAG